MIKRVKQFHPKALLNSDNFRNYIDNFESEILRGISTLSILAIIYRNLESGIYGYKLAKELRKETNHLLFIEEGTLYPILRKLKKDGIIDTVRGRGVYSVFSYIYSCYEELNFIIATNGTLNIKVTIIKGESWEISIYKDYPEGFYLFAPFFGSLVILGIFILFQKRKNHSRITEIN